MLRSIYKDKKDKKGKKDKKKKKVKAIPGTTVPHLSRNARGLSRHAHGMTLSM